MEWRTEWRPLAWILAVFLACFWLPVGSARFDGAVMEALHLFTWYAREHVLLCLVPAFFIAGAIGVFAGQECARPEMSRLIRTRQARLAHGHI